MMKSSADNAKVTKKIRDYKMKDWLFFFQILAIIITIGAFIYSYLYLDTIIIKSIKEKILQPFI